MSKRLKLWKPPALLLLGWLSAAGAVAQAHNPVRVAAAADLRPVLPSLIAEFRAKTGIGTVAIYASSATLASQIISGGPFNLFLSADMEFPQKVIDAGMSDAARPIPYARGTLVLWASRRSPLLRSSSRLTLNALRSPALTKLAIANPEHAPYGSAAMSALTRMGLAGPLKGKLAMAENIAQTAQFAESGNADAALISLTLALDPHLRRTGTYVTVPENDYPAIVQGAIVVRDLPGREEAHRFLDFLLSAPVRKQMAQHGLAAP